MAANSQTVMLTIRSSRPTFRNNHDKLAFAVHASFLASGFDLIATGRPAFADEALTTASQDEVGVDGWNDFEGEYAFVYKKGSKKYLVKCLAIHDKLLVDAVSNAGGFVPAHLEIDVGKFAEESLEGNYAAQYKNFDKLVSDLKNAILFKLDEGLMPVPPPRVDSSSEANEQPRFFMGNDPRSQIHPSGVYIPPIPGNGGGYSDMFPGPGAGIYPGRRGGGEGSMFVGPNDPRFFPQFGDQPGFMGPPQPGVPPPGARFDPIGPGYEPDRLRMPRRPGGRHPDLEHFPDGSDFI